jgi:hypothetical protein
MKKVVETIYSRAMNKRLIIFQRDDGSFGYEDEFFCDDDGYSCWLPQSLPASRFASHAIARCEALSQGGWAGMEFDTKGSEPSNA